MIEAGKHKIHLLASKHASFSENYATFGHWFEIGQLHNLIKLHAKDTDIFHCHNEPNWFVTLIKETCDVPVVLDVHDSFLARTTKDEAGKELPDGTYPIRNTVEERNNFSIADALVFPGESFRDLVVGEYDLKQPNIVLRSHVPRRLYRYSGQDWFGGLVYEGKVQLDTKDRAGHAFKYCDYKEMADACFKEGVPFHLYGARDDKPFMDVYGESAIVHPPEVMDVLLRKISAHDWGLVGNIFPTSEWNHAMPNKLFEYVAAGVPVVAMNAKECEEYVVEKGIGIAVKSLSELKDRWDEHKAVRNNLLKVRASLSMDKNIDALTSLYERIAR